MSDYISKEKLMSHIESQYKSFGEDYDALQILGDIEDFPTEERPHGEWIKKDTYFGKCWATCSVCKKISDGTGQDNGFGHDYSYPNFCPNCGADMRKERG